MVRPTKKASKSFRKPSKIPTNRKSSKHVSSKKSLIPKTSSSKPPSLHTEYATEITKIAKILKAINNPVNSQTSIKTESAHSDLKYSTSETRSNTNIRRPLSKGELKQLLSSITRVASLQKVLVDNYDSQPSELVHLPPPSQEIQSPLPQDDEMTLTNEIETPVVEPVRKSISRAKKVPTNINNPVIPGINNRELARLKSKPKPPLKKAPRKNRKKVKAVADHELTPGENVRGSGSSSSFYKDPLMQARFLREYHEETVRLTNEVPSKDLLDGMVEGDVTKSKTSKTASTKTSKAVIKGKASKDGKQATRKNSSVLPRKRSSVSTRNLSPTKLRKSSTITTAKLRKKSASINKSVKIADKLSVTSTQVGSIKNHDDYGDGHQNSEISSPIASILAQFKRHPMSTKYDEVEATKRFLQRLDPRLAGARSATSSTLSTAGSTHFNPGPNVNWNVDIVNGNFQKQPQFANIEEMLADRMATSNNKSRWEKIPYQPMSHAHFIEMVNKYANPEDKLAFAQEEMARNDKRKERANSQSGFWVSQTSSVGVTPGNLLTLPKSWEIKEKWAEQEAFANAEASLRQIECEKDAGKRLNMMDTSTANLFDKLNFGAYGFRRNELLGSKLFDNFQNKNKDIHRELYR